jgi:guanine deaminase
MFLHN